MATFEPYRERIKSAGPARYAKSGTQTMATATELDIQTLSSGLDAMDLAQTIFGSGIEVLDATYTGDLDSAGIYTGADTTIPGITGSDSGVILSTGNATSFTNSDGSTDTNLVADTGADMAGGIDGDARMDAVSGTPTFDAALLDVTFIPDGDMLTMQFVFSSEEYLEFVNAGVNDAIGVWVNDVYVPLTVSVDRVSIDTVNNTVNQNLYIDNPADTDLYNTEMDGFTVVLSLKAPVNAGEVNTLRIGIADGGDAALDSNLLIAGDSIQTYALAIEDTLQVTAGATRTFDILANDRDQSDLGLTITGINGQAIIAGETVTLPTGQEITLNADGTITVISLTPGSDIFTYSVIDSTGATDTGFVTLNTTAGTAPDGIVQGTSGNDRIDTSYLGDPDGDLVDAGDALGVGGTVGDGDYILAGAGDDSVTAGAGNDVVYAGDGADTVSGGAGDDFAALGTGDDVFGTLAGDESGADTVYGNAGSDQIFGGDGDDRLYGGSEDDTLYGGSGNDVLDGGTGTSELDGGTGDDRLIAAEGDDFLTGGHGNDSIDAGAGADMIDGGTGADTILAGEGDDFVYGGFDYLGPLDPGQEEYTLLGGSSQNVTGTQGNADFVASSFSENGDLAFTDSGAILNGFWVGNAGTPETHTHNFSTEVAGVRISLNGLGTTETLSLVIDGWTVDLNEAIGWGWITFEDPSGSFTINGAGQITGTTDDPTALTDNVATLVIRSTLTTVSLVSEGGDGAVYAIEVDSNPTTILLADEADLIDGGSGNDTILAGEGNDTVAGGDGDDSVEGGFGDDSLSGGAGADVIRGEDGADSLSGGEDNDALFGGDGGDLLQGDGGDDYLDGDFGDDILQGGDGADILQGSEGDDQLSGDAGADTLMGGFGSDTLDGGAGNDLLIGNGNIVNLIQNGSFEDTTGMTATDWGWRGDDGTAPGWFTGPGGVIDIHNSGSGGPTEGTNWLDTEGVPGVTTISQDIQGVIDGTPYRLEFSAVDVPSDDNSLNVYWNGELIGTVDPGADFHEGFLFDVIGGSGDGSNRLTFEITGPVDGAGIQIDDVQFWGPSSLVENTEADVLLGGDDADTIMGAGNDTVDGGEGGTDADILVVSGVDQIIYGGGNNESGTVTFEDGSSLVFSNIETIQADGVLIDAPPPPVDGTAGADDIGDGFVDVDGDQIDGTDGVRDWVLAGAGNDTINAGAGNDTIDAGADDDLIRFGLDHGADSVDGGSGTDRLDFTEASAQGGISAVWGGDTSGSVTGAAGTVQFSAVEGITGTSAGDSIDASASGFSGLSLSGGDGNDSIIGGFGDDALFGDAGDDSLSGGSGNDSLTAGTGADTLLGGTGNDSLDLGPSDGTTDVIVLADGDGADTVYGFEAPLDNGDGTFAGQDLLDVTGLNRPAGSGVNVSDVTVSDTLGDGTGDAVLTFPDGTSLTLVGIDPALAANPAWLEAIGIPAVPTGIVDGTAGSDMMGFGYTDADGDQIEGTDGINDTVEAGAGDDTVQAGTGEDLVYGGDGADNLFGWEGNDTLFGGADADMVDGDAGDDVLFGEGGDDTLVGDDGADSLDGGDGADQLYGGSGNDTLIGGEGPDALWGGDDADLFFGGIGDTVYGGNGGDDQDTLDLRAYGKASTNILFGGGDGESGTVEFLAGDGSVLGSLNFSDIENVIPCFTPGTMILALGGECPVEDLAVGDLVMTRDDGFQRILWVGRRDLAADMVREMPQFGAIRIRAGALGPGSPRDDLIVSPQHRILIAGRRAELLFGEAEVLVAAHHLLGLPGVTVMPDGPVSYIHIMFDQHQIVQSNGAWTESYQPGAATLGSMEKATRDEILALFPELSADVQAYPAARRSLRAHEARVLMCA